MSSSTGMSARDYQHKRLRSKGKNQQQQVETIDSEPALSPRIVTPQSASKPVDKKAFQPPQPLNDKEEDNDPLKRIMSDSYVSKSQVNVTMDAAPASPERDPLKKIMSASYATSPAAMEAPSGAPSPFVHRPTASNGGLTTESPMKVTEPMRYSLTHGKQPVEKKKSSSHRRASDQGGVPSEKFPTESRRASEPFAGSGSRIRKQDPNAYKIFILLLQPQSKIFELIQLIYNPNDTSVGNILSMIPENATEEALGRQDYIGLCRPKTQEEILDTDILASEARPGLVSAKITLGEILVGIPKGYSGQDVSALSKQILANPKIVKLLKRADPLAPKKRRSSRSHNRRRSSRRSSSRENVHILEKLGEEAEEESPGTTDDDERRMRAAMQKAKEQASEANAAISGDVGGRLARSDSVTSISNHTENDSLYTDSTGGSSIDESYSSWSKSFEASFSANSSVCSGASKRAARRRDRQARRLRILKQCAVGAFFIMIALYWMDTRGKSNDQAHLQNDLVRSNPMGLTGVFQCLFLLLTLYKVERLVRSATRVDDKTSNNKINGNTIASSSYYGNSETGDHKCPFLRAANSAMKRFKAKYAKKLKRAKKATKEHKQEESSVVSKRLKNFSLRPASVVVTGNSTDEDDTR